VEYFRINSGTGTATFSGNVEVIKSSTPTIQLTQSGATNYKGYVKLAGNDLEIRGSSGVMEFYNGSVDGNSSALRMSISSGGLVQVGDGTSQNTFLTTKSVAGWYSGIKLTRGLGDGSSTANNNFGMLVTDNGWEVATFTSPSNNATGRSAKLTISSGGDTSLATGNSLFVQGAGRVYTHNVTLREQDNTAKFQIYSSGGGCVFYNSESNGAYYFYTNGSERMRIASGGQVAIGTGTNTTKFRVLQSANSEWTAQFINTGTGPYGVSIDTTANSSNAYSFAVYTNSGTGLFVKNNANVSIGSTNNNAKFFVYGNNHSGTGYYLGYFYNDGNGSDRYGVRINAGANNGSGTTVYLRCDDGDATEVGGLMNASGTFQLFDSSDRSLKENIEDTEINGLSRINALKIRKFNWKKNGILNVAGFIAQEVENIIPEASSPMDSGLLSVSVTSMVPTLVKAIQEQQTIIEDLKARIETLEG